MQVSSKQRLVTFSSCHQSLSTYSIKTSQWYSRKRRHRTKHLQESLPNEAEVIVHALHRTVAPLSLGLTSHLLELKRKQIMTGKRKCSSVMTLVSPTLSKRYVSVTMRRDRRCVQHYKQMPRIRTQGLSFQRINLDVRVST